MITIQIELLIIVGCALILAFEPAKKIYTEHWVNVRERIRIHREHLETLEHLKTLYKDHETYDKQ